MTIQTFPTDLCAGSGKTYIAVLLLKYMIDKELEDRAAGKRRRISFFLVSSTTIGPLNSPLLIMLRLIV